MTSPTGVLAGRALPIVQAPMAGGPSTVALAAAVSGAGGLGFLATGYLSPATVRDQIGELRAATDAPFGVNLFCPGGPGAVSTGAASDVIAAYLARLEPMARQAGVGLGVPGHDDDHYHDKIEVVVATGPAVVSFAFGCPAEAVVERLHGASAEVWVTVTDAREAEVAASVGVDAVVAQGAEAGGHRGSFTDDDDAPLPVLELVGAVAGAVPDLPIVASGGLMSGGDIRAALDAGAVAAQLGTAFLLTPEAATSEVQRAQVASDRPTVLTRAFTGRLARGIANRWSDELGDVAPSAYPEIHHVTAALRAHGRAVGDADLVNLWAGVNHGRARPLPAAEIIKSLAVELHPI